MTDNGVKLLCDTLMTIFGVLVVLWILSGGDT